MACHSPVLVLNLISDNTLFIPTNSLGNEWSYFISWHSEPARRLQPQTAMLRKQASSELLSIPQVLSWTVTEFWSKISRLYLIINSISTKRKLGTIQAFLKTTCLWFLPAKRNNTSHAHEMQFHLLQWFIYLPCPFQLRIQKSQHGLSNT